MNSFVKSSDEKKEDGDWRAKNACFSARHPQFCQKDNNKQRLKKWRFSLSRQEVL